MTEVKFDEWAITTDCPRHKSTVSFTYCSECRYHEGHNRFTVYCGCPKDSKPQNPVKQIPRTVRIQVKMMWSAGASVACIAERLRLTFYEIEKILGARRRKDEQSKTT